MKIIKRLFHKKRDKKPSLLLSRRQNRRQLANQFLQTQIESLGKYGK